MQNWAGAQSYIEGVGDDLFPPNDLALEIQRREHGGTEGTINSLAIGRRRGRSVTPAGSTAKIGAQPRARRHSRIPNLRPVPGPIADDVMFRDYLFACCSVRRPKSR